MTGGSLTTTGATPNFYSFFNTYSNTLPITTHASSTVATISGAIAARNITGITFTTDLGTTPGGVDLVVSGPLFYESRNGNDWAVTKAGAGVMAITSNNHGTSYVFNTGGGSQNGAGYGGTTTISAGTLQLGNNTASGSLNPLSAIVDNGILAFNRTDTITQGTHFNSVISGTGAVTQKGTGTTVLNGANTYTGLTTVNLGTLQLGASNTIKSGNAVTVNSTTAAATATLDLNSFGQTVGTAATSGLTLGGAGGTSTSISQVIGAGPGSILTLAGTTVALSFDPTGNPLGATISATTVNLNGATQTMTIGDSSNASNDLTISSAIASGGASGALTKAGAGVLKLDGAQSYNTLTATAGTTDVNGLVGIGSGTAAVSVTGAGTKLRFGSVSQTLSSLTIGAGSTVIFSSGPATGAFSGGGGGAGGKTVSLSSSQVPEPGTLGLLLVGALGLLNRRRRQA